MSLKNGLDLVPVQEYNRFHKLLDRYLSTGILSCEEAKFVNYMGKFFTYRFCSMAKLRYWDYEGNEHSDWSSFGAHIYDYQA